MEGSNREAQVEVIVTLQSRDLKVLPELFYW